MKNWKIGTRIAAGFAAVTALALALGIFAYSRVASIEKDSNGIVENALPKVYLAGQIHKNVERTYALALQHAMAGDQEKMAGIETQIEAIRSANGKDVAEVEKLLISDKGRALWDPLESTCRHASLSIL